MPEHMLMRQESLPDTPLPHRDYTMHLLQSASENGLLPPETLNALRDGLHKAAAERAAQYTAGKSTTVTRRQAEAFYASVFTQLDAALLTLDSDADALEALHTQPLTALLEQGAVLTIRAYESAKELFRRAWKLTKPVQTSFFAALLKDFELFCTRYDARFNAKDTHVAFSYPLLCGRQITENGAVGVCGYYASLCREGELLHLFPAEDICGMMQRYAARFLTTPDMIAENLAELVLRHWMIRLLCGQADFSAEVTPEMIAAVQAEYGSLPPEMIADRLRQRIEPLLSPYSAVMQYLADALPAFSAALHSRMEQNRLEGWLAPVSTKN